jgi:hypothetical protein
MMTCFNLVGRQPSFSFKLVLFNIVRSILLSSFLVLLPALSVSAATTTRHSPLALGRYRLAIPGPQRTATPPPTRRVVTRTNQRELDLLLLRKPIKSVEDKAARLALQKQINDDFRELQLANNKLMAEVTARSDFDVRLVSGMLGELNSRAKRLKTNLLLPRTEAKKESLVEVSSSGQLQTELVVLDRVIVSFATNELFQNRSVVEMDLAKNASRDLDQIVQLTGRLKKAAEKLRKK